MNIEKYDLAIIGSGSGNSIITPFWDDKKVAIIDSGTFGGTCLNAGCIPTKMFAYPAQLAASSEDAKRLGVELDFVASDWPAIRDRIFSRIDAISAGGEHYRDVELDNTTLISEEVHFSGPKQLTSDTGRVIEASQIVIAAGSRPKLPDVAGTDLPGVHTSDTVMRLPNLPKRIIVVGGKYIGSEFAAVFAGLGSEVIHINRSGQLLSNHDSTISDAFTRAAKQRWQVEPNRTLHSIEQAGDRLRVNVSATGQRQDEVVDHFLGDVVLLATGRIPNTDRLNLGAAGIDTVGDAIARDEYLRVLSGGTPVAGVWALGDIANPQMLKHVANHEQRIVSHNMENPDCMQPDTKQLVPAGVFTRPQIASIGLTEDEARSQLGTEKITVKVQAYGDTAYGWAMEDSEGLVKLIANRSTGHLLGAHIMGPEATNLLQPLITAMSFGITAHCLARGQYWIHPAMAEVVENALLGLDVPESSNL
ncbi:MAG TPA: mycothione reductase [Candidatus Yaniella excrementigallinarum]|nr:mycothione reductase [Candidatus Yaniella excrementigallinarum]